jgi:hypothetical protein
VLATFEDGLFSCLQFAVDLGFDIFYTPHVDDGGTTGTWRNAVKVDPLVRLGAGASAVTYKEVLLDPVTRVLAKVARPGLKVWYSVQGEMNLAVMTYPREYAAVMAAVRKELAGRPDISLYAGVSLNFNKLVGVPGGGGGGGGGRGCTCTAQGARAQLGALRRRRARLHRPAAPPSALRPAPHPHPHPQPPTPTPPTPTPPAPAQGGFRYLHDRGQKELYDLTAVVELLHAGDFLAFSNYPQVDDVDNFGLLESALFQLDQEMAVMNVSIAKLTESRQLICERRPPAAAGLGTRPRQPAALPPALKPDAGRRAQT